MISTDTIISRSRGKYELVSIDSGCINTDKNTGLIKMMEKLIYFTKCKPIQDQKDKFRIKCFNEALVSLKKCETEITCKKDALQLDGIGKGIADRIQIFLELGYLPELESIEIECQTDESRAIDNLTKINGIGPQTAKKLFREHGCMTARQLAYLIKSRQIKVIKSIRLGLKYYKDLKTRIPYSEMVLMDDYLGNRIREYNSKLLAENPNYYTLKMQICGSYRRMQPSSGDIDMLLTWDLNSQDTTGCTGKGTYPPINLENLIDFLDMDNFFLGHLTKKGKDKYMGICRGINQVDNSTICLTDTGRRIDIRLVKPEEWAAAILYFTGSGEFNRKMRTLAITRGFHLNEYGLYLSLNGKKTAQIDVQSERDIFDCINLKWVEPMNREFGKGH